MDTQQAFIVYAENHAMPFRLGIWRITIAQISADEFTSKVCRRSGLKERNHMEVDERFTSVDEAIEASKIFILKMMSKSELSPP